MNGRKKRITDGIRKEGKGRREGEKKELGRSRNEKIMKGWKEERRER